jgi:hypothetical protein
MSTARTLAWLLLPITASIACGDTVSEVFPPKPVFTEHRPLKTEKASKQLGEDCTTSGASECLSGTCFHYKPSPREGYVCSQLCQTDEGCPPLWSCTSIYPGEGNRFCTPPQDWKPRTTAVRVTASSASTRQPAPAPGTTR